MSVCMAKELRQQAEAMAANIKALIDATPPELRLNVPEMAKALVTHGYYQNTWGCHFYHLYSKTDEGWSRWEKQLQDMLEILLEAWQEFGVKLAGEVKRSWISEGSLLFCLTA